MGGRIKWGDKKVVNEWMDGGKDGSNQSKLGKTFWVCS